MDKRPELKIGDVVDGDVGEWYLVGFIDRGNVTVNPDGECPAIQWKKVTVIGNVFASPELLKDPRMFRA